MSKHRTGTVRADARFIAQVQRLARDGSRYESRNVSVVEVTRRLLGRLPRTWETVRAAEVER